MKTRATLNAIQTTSNGRSRLRMDIRGAVQGVGFRPFLYRLAGRLQLAGWAQNTAQGVVVEVEGADADLRAFLVAVERDKPACARVAGLESTWLDAAGYTGFAIRESVASGDKSASLLPDIATCADCLAEVLDPGNRRWLYPFTNCTQCGPRYTVLESLPYDRPHTTMKHFTLCAACRAEYEDPGNRRFHAQPNACPDCGPHLELWDPRGTPLARHHKALRNTADRIRAGHIVAVKGLGGFHLVVDARNEAAVRRLRRRKHREEKPFAILAPSGDWVRSVCRVDALEERLLNSPEAPIVLLRRREKVCGPGVAAAVAPDHPDLGIFLPGTPLHHLLMRELGFPVVATSGNVADETLCTDEREALERLGGLADAFLVHNRPIAHPVDDSIVRVVLDREQVLRRARGYAPLPLPLKRHPGPVLAVGGHLKNTVALATGAGAVLSPHIGNLDSEQTLHTFTRTIETLTSIHAVQPVATVCDRHPDYPSTRHARSLGVPCTAVQHHVAHVLAGMGDNALDGQVLGLAWDGTGWGDDGTVWGGEFLTVEMPAENGGAPRYARAAHFRTFPLPGGEAAVREPRRAALGLLYERFGDRVFDGPLRPPLPAFAPEERRVLRTLLQRGLRSPRTSSVGRLFDAVASLLDLRQRATYEGQAAMRVEFAAAETVAETAYPFHLHRPSAGCGPWVVDWAPMVDAILDDRDRRPVAQIAARFHRTLAEVAVAVARQAGLRRVVLTGGCFQNARLTRDVVERLRGAGFLPYWHQRVPPNDGGLALGQLLAAPGPGDPEGSP